MKRTLSMVVVVGALGLGLGAGCEEAGRDTQQMGEDLEQGAESMGRGAREGFGELADEAREGRHRSGEVELGR